jgi:hypothetical protein
VQIFLLIGMLMMMPMMRRPPERTPLEGGTAYPRQDELKEAAGTVGPVGKVTMVSGCDPEHADYVRGEAKYKRFPGNARPERGDTSRVNAQKRDACYPVDAVASMN